MTELNTGSPLRRGKMMRGEGKRRGQLRKSMARSSGKVREAEAVAQLRKLALVPTRNAAEVLGDPRHSLDGIGVAMRALGSQAA